MNIELTECLLNLGKLKAEQEEITKQIKKQEVTLVEVLSKIDSASRKAIIKTLKTSLLDAYTSKHALLPRAHATIQAYVDWRG